MHHSTVPQIEDAVQQTDVWLGELMVLLSCDRRDRAYYALKTVMPLLRSCLPAAEAAHLSAHLPALVRAMYFEGWRPSREPVADAEVDAFLLHISSALNTSCGKPEDVAHAIFELIARHLTPDTRARIRSTLPTSVRHLWPDRHRFSA